MPETFKIITKLAKPIDCMGCPLEHDGAGFSIPEGKGSLGVLLIGEALGYHEAKDGLPFRPWAPAGSVLERAIRQCGYSREQFGIFNVVACKPAGNELVGKPFELEAIEHCRVHLRRVVERYKPRVILALGAVALRSLSKMTGKKQNLDMIRGYALDCPEFPHIPVIGTYHPSYIIRGNFNVFPVLCRDLKSAVSYAANKPAPVKLNYVENAGPYELNHLIELCEKVPTTLLCPDVETPGDPDSTIELLENSGSEVEEIESSAERVALGLDKKEGKKKSKTGGRIRTDQTIIQMNIAVEPTNAMAFAMTPENKRLMQKLFKLPNPKVNHNMWFFDQPVMKYNDIQVNGRTDDTLWLFHHLFPDIPGKGSKASDDKPDGSLANLQYCASFSQFPFPWKHLSEERPEFYGCCDVHSDLELYWWLEKEAKRMGVWDGYERMVREIAPILIDAASRGIPVNREKLMTFRKSVRANAVVISTGIQALIPDELRGTQPKNGYKRRPKEVEGMVLREFFVDGKVERCECNKIRKKNIEMWQEVPGAAYDDKGRLRAPDPTCELCDRGWNAIQDHLESRWCRLKPFLVTSPQQMKAYAASKHHDIPKNSKKKYAMDRETLDKLIKSTSDPLYKQAIDLRECVKMDSTYGAGWMPHSDGFVHTQFSFLPATGQLSSTGPNVQNCFSGDTEVLTEFGWMRFDALYLKQDTRVAEFNQDTSAIRFSHPDAFIYNPSGQLVNIRTEQQIDLMITGDHECLLRTRKGYNWFRTPAIAYPTDTFQPVSGRYIGGNVQKRESQLAILCAIQADSHLANGRFDWKLKKKRKIERLRWALKTENILHTDSKNEDGYRRFMVRYCDCPSWMNESAKFFGEWILSLDRESLDVLANEVWKWDGCASRKSMYSSNQKSNADWVQIVTMLSGRRARLRTYHNGNPNSDLNYQVDAVNTRYCMTTNATIEQMEGVHPVFCVTMPWGTVVVRRNGNVAITGNCPNISKKGQIAIEFNSAIEALPGYVLTEFDYKSFHAQTLGMEAGDMSYVRLARIDIHSYLAANMLKLPHCEVAITWEDEELRAWLKWYRKNYTLKNGDSFEKMRNGQAKPAILGYGFGLGATKLYELNRESFSNKAETQRLLETLDRTFPITNKFRETIPLIAAKANRLISRFCCPRWFWDVRRYNPVKKDWEHGKDWEKTIAYLPANHAFCHKKQALKVLDDTGYCVRYGFVNDVHDALKFHTHESIAEESLHVVKGAMEFASEVLMLPDGSKFSCEVEVKKGKSWADMQEVHV